MLYYIQPLLKLGFSIRIQDVVKGGIAIMKCLAIVGFNLKGAESQDYEDLKDAFEDKGLKRSISGESGITIQLPSTTYVGILEGESPKAVRTSLHAVVDRVIEKQQLKGKYFIAVGANSSVGVKSF